MKVSKAGDPVTIAIAVGDWYTGQSSKFTGELYNVVTQALTTITDTFYEIKPGEYGVNITPPVGEYFVYIYNAEIYEGSRSVSLVVNSADIDSVSLSVNSIPSDVWAADASTNVTPGSMGLTVGYIVKLLRNKQVTDPNTGIMTVYDDDGTVLFSANIYEDVNAAQGYRGQGVERREKLV